jgi:hypothetical protein
MSSIRTSLMALAFAAFAAAPAYATVSGSYILTILAGKGIPKGASLCVTLTPTGQVLKLRNSGTITVEGATGQYYVLQGELTAVIENVVFTGHLFQGNLVNTALTVVGSGIEAAATYSATPTASCAPPA